MKVARDFDDVMQDLGGESIRAAIDTARWVGTSPPANGAQAATVAFSASPFVWRDPASIARRNFLYSFQLRRGQISSVIGVGAAGKTTWKVGRALCMVTGREFFGHRVWNGPHRVWLINLEDEREEIEKTVHAFMKLWGLSPADLGDRLYIDGVDTGCMAQLKIGVEGERGGYVIQRPVADAMVDALKDRGIDYFDIDPFVSSHSVDENNNGAIDAVTKQWVQVAHRASSAGSLSHHVRKPNGGEATAFDARGAVAMINAARSVLVMQKMSKEVADELGVAECDRKRFVSVYDDKNNKAPPASAVDWYEFESIGLGNSDDTGPEDNIGALKRWEAPNAFAGVTAQKLRAIQTMIDREPARCRKHSKSPMWVGKLVAFVLDMDLDIPEKKKQVEKMIGTWCANGALRTVTRQNEKREMVEYVEVRERAVVE